MRRHEGGLILPALLILLLFGGIAVMLGGNDLAARVELHHHQATIAQLARARAALIGYAQSYHLTHRDQGVGYLPCPDVNSAINDGNAQGSCGSRGDFSIGRFPYRTLGLPPLRDGYGECLWYAVAGSFKNSPKGHTTNWDTAGQFDISDGSRSPNPTLNGDQLAVAVVFAPGRPLTGQNRNGSTPRCSGDANAKSALKAYLEGNYAKPGNLPVVITRGRLGDARVNDIVASITVDNVFSDHFVRRGDFVKFVNGMLRDIRDGALTEAQKSPDIRDLKPTGAVIVSSNIESGGYPARIKRASDEDDESENDEEAEGVSEEGLELSEEEKRVNGILARYESWADQFRYLRCIDGKPCLYYASGKRCEQILMFAGRALPSQNRANTSAGPDAYFEDDNLLALIDPDNPTKPFSGPDEYKVGKDAEDAKDVIQCIK